MCDSELQHQVGGGDEANLDTGQGRTISQGASQVRLAYATGREQDDVLGTLDEAQSS